MLLLTTEDILEAIAIMLKNWTLESGLCLGILTFFQLYCLK